MKPEILFTAMLLYLLPSVIAMSGTSGALNVYDQLFILSLNGSSANYSVNEAFNVFCLNGSSANYSTECNPFILRDQPLKPFYKRPIVGLLAAGALMTWTVTTSLIYRIRRRRAKR